MLQHTKGDNYAIHIIVYYGIGRYPKKHILQFFWKKYNDYQQRCNAF